ncbi:hypothetical protein GCM10009557_32390 [Virgisporangium ochraceum]|uniref:Uncharacterized protein n=1 Tax=Virgisporangium ochraceum TaxID=65505 RepID=A0A8J4A0K8_9ACTN|nr:hypothetical protein [Virgisporangium ochraceum]GIJ70746.1 hypothetical protein Voc01_056630 [Virgisporangium ochraceum]
MGVDWETRPGYVAESVTAADLEPLRDLPLEHLTANSASDLAPLSGHRTLRSLSLTRGAAPADLTPLRTVAHLHGLSLTDADPAETASCTRSARGRLGR